MNTIFSEPSAHDVTHIRAEAVRHADFACLRLSFKGEGIGGAREGDFDIYGPVAMADKFKAIAAAINVTFKTVEVESMESMTTYSDKLDWSKPYDEPDPYRVAPINENPSYRAAMTDAGRGRLLR